MRGKLSLQKIERMKQHQFVRIRHCKFEISNFEFSSSDLHGFESLRETSFLFQPAIGNRKTLLLCILKRIEIFLNRLLRSARNAVLIHFLGGFLALRCNRVPQRDL